MLPFILAPLALKVIGGALAAAAVGGLVYSVVRLSRSVLREYAKDKVKNATSAKITQCLKTGDVNIVKTDLFDSEGSYIDEIEFQAETIDENIYKGAVLYL